jgi:hypothetical protein
MITYQQKVLSMLEAKLAIYDFELVDRGMCASNVSTLSIQQPVSLHEYGYIWFNFQSGYFDMDVYRYNLRRLNDKPTLLSSARHVETHNINAFTCLMQILTAYLQELDMNLAHKDD